MEELLRLKIEQNPYVKKKLLQTGDYMIVEDEKIMPVSTEEFSIFEIPVIGFDYKMPVKADTTAMSTPHEIDYTIFFDSSTITE